jgi:hypothetical protein
MLHKLLRSLESSTVQPDSIYVINNGDGEVQSSGNIVTYIHKPAAPLGVAESWNWFIRNVPQERIICNDDVQFSPHSIETLINTEGDLVFTNECGFSCFLIRDRCVELVGEFDETISPGYAYYEDVDYAYRMVQVPEIRRPRIDAGIIHEGSATLKSRTPDEVKEHWRRFFTAKANFEHKWGFTVESLAGIV